jgi:hypothetical protein
LPPLLKKVAPENSMPSLIALIDANFAEMIAFYKMFSADDTWAGHIEIPPRDVHAIQLTSFEALVTQLRDYLQRGNREFLVGMHGYTDSLPYPITAGTGVSPDVEFMNLLRRAADGDDGAKEKMLTWQDDKKKSVFPTGARADRLINVVRDIRRIRIDHLEIRGCNIGAGGALKAVHDCLNSRHTVAPNVTFISGLMRTAAIRTNTQAALEKQTAELGTPKRTFSRTECALPASNQVGPDDLALAIRMTEVSVRPHRFSFGISALSQAAVLGWTQNYCENSYYFFVGKKPPGGGYKTGANLPLIGMWTPQGKLPFLFPGDGVEYLSVLVVENTP